MLIVINPRLVYLKRLLIEASRSGCTRNVKIEHPMSTGCSNNVPRDVLKKPDRRWNYRRYRSVQTNMRDEKQEIDNQKKDEIMYLIVGDSLPSMPSIHRWK